jgi:glycosyltransferase involved in cell wall biosynthesis
LPNNNVSPSNTHIVLLPTYNTGPRLAEVAAEALRHWQPVMAVVDGSTDGSERAVLAMAQSQPALTVLVLPQNSGKGAAVLAGAAAAQSRGFTHALVMDADGQHPAASIAEFMAASQREPGAMILGSPLFPPNIPRERLHGRKLSVAMTRLQMLGPAIDDPLFGFRVYPIAPLLRVLGPRRGGRRYDFDTEAAVRLGWAGVRPRNIAAPVRYFSREEGGISHFHYVRDNATLVWMHTRLLAELLFRRWPSLRRHRRAWRDAAIAVALIFSAPESVRAEDATSLPLAAPEHRLESAAYSWADLVEAFAANPDVTAAFTERRYFPFKKAPVVLTGEVRVSHTHGLSLCYLEPEPRIVIVDARGVLIRAPAGERAPPADPRAAAANRALLNILRFDFEALGHDFELYGRREGSEWLLALVPRTASLKRSTGEIHVTGNAAAISRIEIHRTAKHRIEISMLPPHPSAEFTAEELAEYFR